VLTLRTLHEHDTFAFEEVAMFFRFPPDARWNPEHSVVEFGIGIGDYEGVVRAPRRVFQTLLPEAPLLNAVSKPTIFTGPGSN
jgi:hypothetical protein